MERIVCREGMARCVEPEGITPPLRLNEIVYIREIPNWPGHVIILKNGEPPGVGYHLDRFELLDADDSSW